MEAAIKLAITFTKYNEPEQEVNALASKLKQLYPDATLLQFDDKTQRLKLPQHGGQWTLRFLTAFIATDCDVLIKIDPDTEARRAATKIPNADLFGNLVAGQVLGGAMGFSRAGAQKIVESGVLTDAKYQGQAFTYARYTGKNLRPGEPSWDKLLISCQDKILADVVTRLNLKTAQWDEISVWAEWWAKPGSGDYAFVHPKVK
jgi:hypothetical protein